MYVAFVYSTIVQIGVLIYVNRYNSRYAGLVWSTRPLEARMESGTEAARFCSKLAFHGLKVLGMWSGDRQVLEV
jgi:hypothetical protein